MSDEGGVDDNFFGHDSVMDNIMGGGLQNEEETFGLFLIDLEGKKISYDVTYTQTPIQLIDKYFKDQGKDKVAHYKLEFQGEDLDNEIALADQHVGTGDDVKLKIASENTKPQMKYSYDGSLFKSNEGPKLKPSEMKFTNVNNSNNNNNNINNNINNNNNNNININAGGVFENDEDRDEDNYNNNYNNYNNSNQINNIGDQQSMMNFTENVGPKQINVNVFFPDKSTNIFKVDPTIPINKDLSKKVIDALSGGNNVNCTFQFKGKMLSSDKSLSYYNVCDGDNLYVLVRLHGGI